MGSPAMPTLPIVPALEKNTVPAGATFTVLMLCAVRRRAVRPTVVPLRSSPITHGQPSSPKAPFCGFGLTPA